MPITSGLSQFKNVNRAMKVKATTIFLITIAVVLGIIVYAELQGTGNPNNSDGETQPIFAFEEDDVESVAVTTGSDAVAFERDDTSDWQMTEPEQSPASDASIAYLLNLLATGESDRTLTVPRADLDNYGLEQPAASITVELENETDHQLLLGNLDFNGSFIYAQADPSLEPTGDEVDILLVSPDFENAVSRPIDDWKEQPGEAPDEQSSPTPDASPAPVSPEASP
ncbi:MAG TPA: DUF4340 domain-containing protein [Elainellaceae cyanobacterium]